MRSIWKGSIAFGLVNVPIKVYSATETHDVSLHQVHDEDSGRIRYKRVCEFGHDVDYEHIQKAYEEGDRTVVLTPDDLKALPTEQSHEIEVLEFVPTDQVDPVAYEKSYYLEPDSRSPKAYVLLRETLERTDRTAIVQFTLRQKTRLGALRVHGDVLVLQGLLWGDEVRTAEFASLATDVTVSANELTMSSSLVESMSTDFDPEKFTDDYQAQLQQLIDAKLEAGDDVDTSATFGDRADDEQDAGGDVIDLMAALRASVDRNRASRTSGRGGAADTDDAAARTADQAPPKKTAAKKTPAKRTPAKKAPADEAPAAEPAAKKAPARSRSTKKAS